MVTSHVTRDMANLSRKIYRVTRKALLLKTN